MHSFQNARSNLKNYLRNSSGSMMMMTALSILPLIVSAGAAIDAVRITREQVAFSDAVDSAALAIAASPQADLSGLSQTAKTTRLTQLTNTATDYIAKNYKKTDQNGITTSLDITNTKVTLTASHPFPTSIMSIVGIYQTNLDAVSEVTKSGTSMEVALMLDNTASMAGSRIASLKTAAKDFVDIVVGTSQSPFYSKVALVPYNMGVNVGSTYAASARGSASSGTSTTPGSTNYKFKNTSNQNVTFAISNCVSERTGSEAYTDASVSTSKVGRNYASPNNPCNTAPILPLSSDKTALKTAIDNMVASGSTAGQVGVAWGWYMLSPNFGLWSGNSAPAAYGTDHLKKVAILMTDGEYNSPYCNGVISKDATTGSGDPLDHINCNATNGNAYAQSEALCAAMKAQGITVYTIAFQLINTTAAQDLMTNCASGSGNRYDAADETQLKAVFKTLANDLLDLRLSK